MCDEIRIELKNPPVPMMLIYRDEKDGSIHREQVLQIVYKIPQHQMVDDDPWVEMCYMIQCDYDAGFISTGGSGHIGIEYNGIEENWD